MTPLPLHQGAPTKPGTTQCLTNFLHLSDLLQPNPKKNMVYGILRRCWLHNLSLGLLQCRVDYNALPWASHNPKLQMKGQWKSNTTVWFPFMYSHKLNCYFQNIIIKFCLPVPTLKYLWDIYIFPESVCLFWCREICGPILGIFKSLTDTWMRKLGLRPRNSQKRNIQKGFSLQCMPESTSSSSQGLRIWPSSLCFSIHLPPPRSFIHPLSSSFSRFYLSFRLM